MATGLELGVGTAHLSQGLAGPENPFGLAHEVEELVRSLGEPIANALDDACVVIVPIGTKHRGLTAFVGEHLDRIFSRH